MKHVILTAATLAVAGPAYAQSVSLKPFVDLRTRYENVDQDGVASDADALTIRARGGLEADAGGLSALIEGEGTLAAVDHYYDGLNGAATRPLVADPQNIALYRAQLRYARPGWAITAGRQRIALDDERFVGAVNFRDNGQTFDAVRFEWNPVKRLKADVSYSWSVRTIWGIDGHDARQQAVSGNNVFANVGYQTSFGTLTGFAYLIDQDELAVQGYRLSSQTYGVRFAGAHTFSKQAKLSYQASYARQSDYHRNPNDYTAGYYLVDGSLDVAQFKIGVGYEVLGADHGLALTSFQTPLATGFKFQGWADKFLTTPPDGVRDLYGSVGYGLKTGTALGVFTFQGVYHHFDSDRLVRRYGDEIDALASMKIKRTTLSLRYADYRAHGFATDTRKLWLEVDWAL
ncbi:alginate export family protein [Sphingomonas nostoxanthinifaciens]|uniref:alginate export family protein n=1 Tax=Sphingomonas nostoxanthinifaciens TaxID=2872652 RepID=UPI001CC1E0D1|nr:alginate export family protein [Sphingomonas nostoxanthinifaciens]UAK23875.1 alginate export family protein [Sphingomonas nostoxanthinifaciens]